MQVRATVTLEPDVIRATREIVEQQDGTISGLVNALLRDWLLSGSPTLFRVQPYNRNGALNGGATPST